MVVNNLIEDYFNYQDEYTKKYGERTIVLMQVGSFHEAYQTLELGFDLSKIANICNFVVSKKNKSIPTVDLKNPYMMGFPSASLQKYLKILVDNLFTVIVIDQVTPPPNPKREITGIYTPGTYCEEINNPDSNYISSIYIEEVTDIASKQPSMFLAGISIIDVTTGKSLIYECYSQKMDESIVLDDVVKIIQSYPSKELIVTTSNLTTITADKLISYLELSDKLYHHQTISQLIDCKGYKNVPKIGYQEELFKKVYGNKLNAIQQSNVIESIDLEMLSYARISLVILLNYINEHNQSLLKNLDIPQIMQKQNNLYLGNNAIYQLNIFNTDLSNSSNLYSNTTKYRSLFDVINYTSTSMGRRYLKNSLVNPLLDIDLINSRYNTISYLIENDRWKNLEIGLREIPDIERYIRKLSISNIHPIDLNNCINGIMNAFNCICKVDLGNNEISRYSKENLIKDVKIVIDKFNSSLNFDELGKYLINDITGPIFKPGIYKDIDKLVSNISNCDNFMNILTNTLNEKLNKQIPKKKSKKDLDSDDDEVKTDQLINIQYNERDGYYLSLTKRRAELLQQYLEVNNKIKIGDTILEYKNMEFKSLVKGNSCKIIIPEIQKKSDEKIDLLGDLRKEIKDRYTTWLSDIYSQFSETFNNLNDYISKLDFCKSGAKVAILNKYYKPTINNKYDGKSYLDAENIRHPICEKLLTDTEYVPITIQLGVPEQSGILLFGLNSVGKSTLQKSIGINIILAQIGYYVPASKFEYYPYTNLMTRISANDNLFKGLSSFALELSELRSILKRSDKNTLIIADEVCKGTEHQSSLIIVMSMLEILSQNKCSFITATHLHELTFMNRLHNLKDVKMYHLHVDYDEKNNILKYNRQLLPGSGENFYGLNVAKYLINDSTFFKVANEIKNEISPTFLVGNKTSKYNSKLWINECQICEYKPINEYDKPLETHHINFQKNCDKDGFILAKPHIHKNHKSNLCILCYKCHDKIDTNEIMIYGYEDTSHGSQLKYNTVDTSNLNSIIEVNGDSVTIEVNSTDKKTDLQNMVKELVDKKYTQKRILEELKKHGTQIRIKEYIKNIIKNI
jgi:DNA mismatch repair protein MutS